MKLPVFSLRGENYMNWLIQVYIMHVYNMVPIKPHKPCCSHPPAQPQLGQLTVPGPLKPGQIIEDEQSRNKAGFYGAWSDQMNSRNPEDWSCLSWKQRGPDYWSQSPS